MGGKAQKVTSEIIIDGAATGNLPPFWQNFAQGGEEKEKMIEPVKNEVAHLKPQYIRIDHLYDFYDVVSRSSQGSLTYNWQILDERVNEILETGARPFLSFSYLPPALAGESIVSAPNSYPDWQNLIQATIEHYSGRGDKAIPEIYYEVWNEPDLFGKMSPSQYYQLYLFAARGAAKAANTLPFKFGGPATIGINRTWMNDFLGFVASGQIRLDFVSWHSYGTNPEKVKLETQTLNSLANFQPFKNRVEKLVTEWGPDSELNSVNDSYAGAAQTIASAANSVGMVDRLFAFELKDGLDPRGNQFWGRWGLITHQKFGVVKKPRYFAFDLLNRSLTYFLNSSVNHPNIFSLSSTDGLGNYFLILTNYPFQGPSVSQEISLKIDRFLPGLFTKTVKFLGDNQSQTESKLISTGTQWEDMINLNPFSIATIELKRNSAATTKAPGASDSSADNSCHLVSPLPPLIYPLFSIPSDNQQNGQISFLVKPNWDGSDAKERFFFETRVTPSTRLYAKTRKGLGTTFLDFTFEQASFPPKVVSLEIFDWRAENWYPVSFAWNNTQMELNLQVGAKEQKETLGAVSQALMGKFIYLGSDFESKNQIDADLDNIKIDINGQTLFSDNCN